MVTASRCPSHPDIETNLACSKCAKLICPRCLVQTPVGARCKECTQVSKLPTFDVSTSHYAKATLLGFGLALLLGTLWAIAAFFVPYGTFIIPLAIGYSMGELISLSVNRKRGPGLQVIAGGSVFLSFVVSRGFFLVGSVGLYGLLGVGIGIFIAINRVR